MRKLIGIVALLGSLAVTILLIVAGRRFEPVFRENGLFVVTAYGLQGQSPQHDGLFVSDAEHPDLVRIKGLDGLSQPAWSPDGTRIAFVGPGPGRMGDLYVMEADGSDVRRLTGTPFEEDHPAWSPDGTRIAFGREGDLWVMNADGTDKALVLETSAGSGWASSPEWSPDGSSIAFVRPFDFGIFDTCPRNTGTGVFVMDVDGSDVRRLTIEGCRHTIAWSPSGEHIAIIGDRGRIQLLDRDGATVSSISPPELPPDDVGFDVAGPVWSPDNEFIAFSFQGNIWTLEIGSNRWRQVTRDTGFAVTDLDWAPSSGATVGP